MFRSIQWTLQLWHAGLLALVLVGFGSASYFGIARSRYQQLDANLERSVIMLAAGFRPPKLPVLFSGGVSTSGPSAETKPGGSTKDDGIWLQRSDTRPVDTAYSEAYVRSKGPSAGEANDSPRNPLQGLPTLEFEVPPALVQHFMADQPESDYYVIWDYDGRVIKASSARAAAEVSYPGTRPEWSPRPSAPGPPNIRKRGQFREAYINGPLWTRVLIGRSIHPEQVELRNLAFLLAAIGTGVLVLGLVGGWMISLRAVKPIRAITGVAREISASNLSRRIDAADIQSELGSLAAVLNDMFARLDAAFQQQIRFTADASHELRTPLSVIHTHVQLALSRERSASEYRKTIETCLRASSRMKDLVDSLLLLAGADAGRLKLNRERFDWRSVVEGCIDMVAPLAEARRIVIETDLRAAELNADLSRIAQVTTNLLTNAIRYNREEGRIRAKLDTVGPKAILTISDTGFGIPKESQSHIFERFYRVDKARSREEGGSGLGLAICKTIVEVHGGTITFSTKAGQGTTFTVVLPLPERLVAT